MVTWISTIFQAVPEQLLFGEKDQVCDKKHMNTIEKASKPNNDTTITVVSIFPTGNMIPTDGDNSPVVRHIQQSTIFKTKSAPYWWRYSSWACSSTLHHTIFTKTWDARPDDQNYWQAFQSEKLNNSMRYRPGPNTQYPRARSCFVKWRITLCWENDNKGNGF